jgi:hypothetical protein
MTQRFIADIWALECLLYVCIAIYAVLSCFLGVGIAWLDRQRDSWRGLLAVMIATFTAVLYGQPTMTFPVIGHASVASVVAPVIVSPMLVGYGASVLWMALRQIIDRYRCRQQ